jgi:hypothetical protein
LDLLFGGFGILTTASLLAHSTTEFRFELGDGFFPEKISSLLTRFESVQQNVVQNLLKMGSELSAIPTQTPPPLALSPSPLSCASAASAARNSFKSMRVTSPHQQHRQRKLLSRAMPGMPTPRPMLL